MEITTAVKSKRVFFLIYYRSKYTMVVNEQNSQVLISLNF